MANIQLKAQRRTALGRKVNRLRREGWIPANIYGNRIDSTPVQVNAREFWLTSSKIHSATMVDLSIEGEPRSRTVFVRSVARSPRTGEPVHLDFYQVRMDESIKTTMPLHFVGEPPVLKTSDGMLMRNHETIEVEALPSNLPEQIEVDLSRLVDFDTAIHVSDLRVPAGVTVLTSGDELIAKVAASTADRMAAAEAAEAAPAAGTESAPESTEAPTGEEGGS